MLLEVAQVDYVMQMNTMRADFEALTVVRFTAVPVERLCLTSGHHSTAHHGLQEPTMAVFHLL